MTEIRYDLPVTELWDIVFDPFTGIEHRHPVNLSKCDCADRFGPSCRMHEVQYTRSFRVENCFVPYPSGRVELAFIPPHDRLATPGFNRQMPWAPLMRKHSADRMTESFLYWCDQRPGAF